MLKISQYGEVVRLDMARTIAGRGRYWTTAYYVDGLLIDTGCAHTAGELEKAFLDQPLSRIINTHSHEDHIGGNGPLQRQRPGLGISAHPHAVAVLKNPRGLQPLHCYRRYFWGWPEASRAEPIQDQDELKTGRHTFRVIYTPGHSIDHLCLYDPNEGWIFTGDVYVGGRDRALREGYDIWQIIASLKSISELDLVWLFPGSAQVRENPKEALKKKINYLEVLGEQVLEMNGMGQGVGAIARALLGGPMWVEIVTLGHFSRRQLVLSYLQTPPADAASPKTFGAGPSG